MLSDIGNTKTKVAKLNIHIFNIFSFLFLNAYIINNIKKLGTIIANILITNDELVTK